MTSQNVISSYGGRRHLPFVFTEHGIIALASVLKNDIAAEMSGKIVRAFIETRKALLGLQEYSLEFNIKRIELKKIADSLIEIFQK